MSRGEVINPIERVNRYPAPVIIGMILDTFPKRSSVWVDANLGKPLERAYELDGCEVHGGVAVFDNGLESRGRMIFNGSAIDEVQKVYAGPLSKYELTIPEQDLVKPRPTRRQYLGSLGAGITAAAPAYGLGPIAGPLTGLAIAGGVYGVGRIIGKHDNKKSAIEAWQNFGDWLRQPENGAISFSISPTSMHPYTGETRWRRSALASTELPLQGASAEECIKSLKWAHQHINSALTAHLTEKGRFMMLDVPMVIKDLLANDSSPAELWRTGFGDKVKQLADNEKAILGTEKLIKSAQERDIITGVKSTVEREALKSELEAKKGRHAELVLEMIEICKSRSGDQTLEKNEALANKIASGDLKDEPHKYELDIQELYAVATKIVTGLDWKQPKSTQIMEWMLGYLDVARETIDDPAQIGQFCAGMVKQLSEQFPDETPIQKNVVLAPINSLV